MKTIKLKSKDIVIPFQDEAAKGVYMEDWKKVYVEGAKLNN